MVYFDVGMGGEVETTAGARRRLTARMEGHVQGVGFRFSTVAVAGRFSVTGYVQNLMDGDVRVVAEGAEQDVLKFMDALRGSHVYRYVRKEQLAWSAATGEFAGFDVRYA